jgi:hypothetical protein
MTKDKEVEKEKSQLSWRMVGRELYCDIPGTSESCSIDIDKGVHESWNDFIKVYGIKQWIASANAKNSIKIPDQLKIDIIDCQFRLANEKDEEEKKSIQKELTELEEKRAAIRVAGVKSKSGEIKTMVFAMMKALKVEKPATNETNRETKAQVEQRVKNELKEKAIAAGMPPEMAATIFG